MENVVVKKFGSLLSFLVQLCCFMCVTASAADLKVSGYWMHSFTFADNLFSSRAPDRNAAGGDGTFSAEQRVRMTLSMVAGESLSGSVELQVGNGLGPNSMYRWGESGVGGSGKVVTARQAYLDWVLPSTDIQVRMGRSLVVLPSYTFGSTVLALSTDGVMVSAPVNDSVTLTLGWLRPYSSIAAWGREYQDGSSVDLGFLSADVSGENFKITPWGMFGVVGNNVGDWKTSIAGENVWIKNHNKSDMLGFEAADRSTMAYWAGLSGEISLFDPFRFTADFFYSANDANGRAGRSGWYAAAGVEMNTARAIPFLRGWYSTGDDADSEKSGRILTVGRYWGHHDASSIYFDADNYITGTPDVPSADGTWGVQLGVKEVSFLNNLTHKLSVSYFQGTNNTNRITAGLYEPEYGGVKNTPIGYLTTRDSAWSIDSVNTLALGDGFSINLILAYLVTNFDEEVWRHAGNDPDYGNIFRGTLNFTYFF